MLWYRDPNGRDTRRLASCKPVLSMQSLQHLVVLWGWWERCHQKKSRGEAHCGCPKGDAKDSAAVLSRLTEDCTGCTFPGSPIRFLERYLRLYLSRYRCTLAKAGPVALVWPA